MVSLTLSSVQANAYGQATNIDVPLEPGEVLVGPVGFATGQGLLAVTGCRYYDATHVRVGYINTSSQARTNQTLTVYCLIAKGINVNFNVE